MLKTFRLTGFVELAIADYAVRKVAIEKVTQILEGIDYANARIGSKKLLKALHNADTLQEERGGNE